VDPPYKAAFDEAWEMGVQALEDVAAERAQLGWEEPVVFQGKFSYPVTRGENGRMRRSTQPLTVTKFSDSMLQFMLRGAKPEKYRERHDVQVTGAISIVERLQAGRKRAAAAVKPSTDDDSGND
jgi:hypothetical protein